MFFVIITTLEERRYTKSALEQYLCLFPSVLIYIILSVMGGGLFGLALRVFHVLAMQQSLSFATVRYVLDSCIFLNML